MADIVSQAKRSAIMRAVKGTWTRPEAAVAKLLTNLRYRPETHVSSLPGTPDFVFRRRRKLIFVHGCFWHRHSCKHTTTPKSRVDFWITKFEQNKSRDRRNIRTLRSNGWRVLIIWQCQLNSTPLLQKRLLRFLRARSRVRLPRTAKALKLKRAAKL